MPKEEDHPKDEGNNDPKEERSQGAVEEAVRKRVRANTPSPHRSNMPQGEAAVASMRSFIYSQAFSVPNAQQAVALLS